MAKKSEIQDKLEKLKSILELLEKYPDFKKLFPPKDLAVMKKNNQEPDFNLWRFFIKSKSSISTI